MAFVYSTAPVGYTFILPDGKRLTIEGGAGVSTRNLLTPKGVMTTVKDDDLEYIQGHPSFIAKVKKGVFVVDKREMIADRVAESMAPPGDMAQAPDEEFVKKSGTKAKKKR
jgi:hypothetical protein